MIQIWVWVLGCRLVGFRVSKLKPNASSESHSPKPKPHKTHSNPIKASIPYAYHIPCIIPYYNMVRYFYIPYYTMALYFSIPYHTVDDINPALPIVRNIPKVP